MENFLKASRNAPEWKSGNYFNYCSKIFANFSKGKSIGHGSINIDILTGKFMFGAAILYKNVLRTKQLQVNQPSNSLRKHFKLKFQFKLIKYSSIFKTKALS